MSRASYVYVIEDGHGAIAAFTVKHELVAYLRGRHGWEFGDWKVVRLRDAQPSYTPVVMTREALGG